MAILETLLALKGAAAVAGLLNGAAMPLAKRYAASKKLESVWGDAEEAEVVSFRATPDAFDAYIALREEAANASTQEERDAAFDRAEELLLEFTRLGKAHELSVGKK
jgi:hypothetical protein